MGTPSGTGFLMILATVVWRHSFRGLLHKDTEEHVVFCSRFVRSPCSFIEIFREIFGPKQAYDFETKYGVALQHCCTPQCHGHQERSWALEFILCSVLLGFSTGDCEYDFPQRHWCLTSGLRQQSDIAPDLTRFAGQPGLILLQRVKFVNLALSRVFRCCYRLAHQLQKWDGIGPFLRGLIWFMVRTVVGFMQMISVITINESWMSTN